MCRNFHKGGGGGESTVAEIARFLFLSFISRCWSSTKADRLNKTDS